MAISVRRFSIRATLLALMATAIPLAMLALASADRPAEAMPRRPAHLPSGAASAGLEKAMPEGPALAWVNGHDPRPMALDLSAQTAPGERCDGPCPALKVFYFYAQNDPLDEALKADFEKGLARVQEWYGQQTGKTFAYGPATPVQGLKTVAEYCASLPCQPTTDWQALYWAVVEEIRGREMLKKDEVYLIAVQTYEIGSSLGNPGGPWYSGAGGGIATVGRRELAAIAEACSTDTQPARASGPSRDCWQRDRALGIMAHELGHAFNLPHPHEDVYGGGQDRCDPHCAQTVMWNYPTFPQVGLLDIQEHPEVQSLRQNPLFRLEAQSLSPGWNLVTYPRSTPLPVEEGLAPIRGKYTAVYAWEPAKGSSWLYYLPGVSSSTLSRLEPGHSYWVLAGVEVVLIFP